MRDIAPPTLTTQPIGEITSAASPQPGPGAPWSAAKPSTPLFDPPGTQQAVSVVGPTSDACYYINRRGYGIYGALRSYTSYAGTLAAAIDETGGTAMPITAGPSAMMER